MPHRCILYYVTDRSAFQGNEVQRRTRLLDKIAEAAAAGVDYIQLREKNLASRELESLARDASAMLQRLPAAHSSSPTLLLINSRSDVALASNSAGVHLQEADISPADVRTIWQRATTQPPFISVSCHSPEQVAQAAAQGANLAIFAPVFEKKDAPGIQPQGLAALTHSSHFHIPVLALGGITLENARTCLQAGASGIAAIRLFQENEIAAVVHHSRA